MSFTQFMDLLNAYEDLEGDSIGYFFNTLMSESDLKINLEKARSELKKHVKVLESYIFSLREMPQVNFYEMNKYFDSYIIILEDTLTIYKALIKNSEQLQFALLKYREEEFDIKNPSRIYANRQLIKSRLALNDVRLAELAMTLQSETSLQQYILPLSISVSKAIARVIEIEAISMIIMTDEQSEFSEKDVEKSAKMGLKVLDNLDGYTVLYARKALGLINYFSTIEGQLTLYQSSLFERYFTKSDEIEKGYYKVGNDLKKYFDRVIQEGLYFVESDEAKGIFAEIELEQNYVATAEAESVEIFNEIISEIQKSQ